MNDSNHRHYHIMIPTELHGEIEDFRWSNRLTKTEAVCELIKIGLKVFKESQEENKPRK